MKSFVRSSLPMHYLASLLVLLLAFGTTGRALAQSSITPATSLVPARGTYAFSGTRNGAPLSGGYWWVGGTGTGDAGAMDANGVYHAPYFPPTPNTVTVGYYYNGSSTTTNVTVGNPVPKLYSLNVSSIYQLSTPIIVGGDGFAPGAVISVQGKPMPTTYIGQDRLSATAVLSAPINGPITITVTNPAPGPASGSMTVPGAFGSTGVSPANLSIHAQSTQTFTQKVNGQPLTGGYWWVSGTGDVGYMDTAGVYHAPVMPPTPGNITVGYYYNGSSITTNATVTNPVPRPDAASVSTLTQLSTQVSIHGTGFIPGSTVVVQGKPMPTNYISANWLTTTVTLASAVNGTVPLVVTNPSPGSSSGAVNVQGVFPGIGSVSPSTLASGWVTVNVTGTGYTTSSVVMLDGKPMKTTFNSATSITGYGYLPPWKNETTAAITTVPSLGSAASASIAVPVTNASLSYDTAARFTQQAAFGPRPDLVEHIQKVGLQGFLTEQIALPGITYPAGVLPRFPYLQTAVSGSPVLRMRVAMALQTFIDNQAITEEFQSYAPWEQKLEADDLGNFRQLMTDIVSDPRLTDELNLPGNVATSYSSHPNQNFAREVMQLFTLGTSMLNDDGSIQTDSTGRVIPAYDQNTILDLSRVFTGWNFGPLVNPTYQAFGVDFSQPLAGNDSQHDHGSKTLFGTVNLPTGQDIVTDRNQALDAIFNHQNVPPFIASRLIEQLVKSNPSPAYVQRISAVFKNNGKGVRGDMAATVSAILLDPEARAGDTQPMTVSDGYLQDPLLWQISVLNVLQQSGWDGQAIYMPGSLGQDWWHPLSIFSFYPPTYLIPGTSINSPQFSLLNNLTQTHRSQYLYGIVSGTSSGFASSYQANSFLYTAFTNIPDLIDGLNHLAFHGQMPAATQSAIINYCAGVPNQNQAFTDAIFLALNSDSFNVAH